VATHVGPYDQLSLTAHALLAWIGEHGHTVGDALREVYISDPRRTAPEHLVTDLMINVEEEEEEEKNA
jgi:effector-binding domain-containing protein